MPVRCRTCQYQSALLGDRGNGMRETWLRFIYINILPVRGSWTAVNATESPMSQQDVHTLTHSLQKQAKPQSGQECSAAPGIWHIGLWIFTCSVLDPSCIFTHPTRTVPMPHEKTVAHRILKSQYFWTCKIYNSHLRLHPCPVLDLP